MNDTTNDTTNDVLRAREERDAAVKKRDEMADRLAREEMHWEVICRQRDVAFDQRDRLALAIEHAHTLAMQLDKLIADGANLPIQGRTVALIRAVAEAKQRIDEINAGIDAPPKGQRVIDMITVDLGEPNMERRRSSPQRRG